MLVFRFDWKAQTNRNVPFFTFPDICRFSMILGDFRLTFGLFTLEIHS